MHLFQRELRTQAYPLILHCPNGLQLEEKQQQPQTWGGGESDPGKCRAPGKVPKVCSSWQSVEISSLKKFSHAALLLDVVII